MTSLCETWRHSLASVIVCVSVVATSGGGAPEVISNGEHGLLVPVRDAQALTAAVCTILTNPYLAQQLSDQGDGRVAGDFSLYNMMRGTSDLYLKLPET